MVIISADGVPVIATEKEALIRFNLLFGAALPLIIPLYRYVEKISMAYSGVKVPAL